jgi:hypothetical protein
MSLTPYRPRRSRTPVALHGAAASTSDPAWKQSPPAGSSRPYAPADSASQTPQSSNAVVSGAGCVSSAPLTLITHHETVENGAWIMHFECEGQRVGYMRIMQSDPYWIYNVFTADGTHSTGVNDEAQAKAWLGARLKAV